MSPILPDLNPLPDSLESQVIISSNTSKKTLLPSPQSPTPPLTLRRHVIYPQTTISQSQGQTASKCLLTVSPPLLRVPRPGIGATVPTWSSQSAGDSITAPLAPERSVGARAERRDC